MLNFGNNPFIFSPDTVFVTLTVTGTPMIDDNSPRPILHWRVNLVKRASRDPGCSLALDTSGDMGTQRNPVAWVLCVLAPQLRLRQD